MSEIDATSSTSVASKCVAKTECNITNTSEIHNTAHINTAINIEEPSSQGGDNKSNDKNQVCRDYLHNICNRGKNCKFSHPPKHEDKKDIENYNFCIDFQNNGCKRENCRFIHASQYDVEAYRATGEVTIDLARAIAAVTKDDTINGVPICKEYQIRKCTRGPRCRFWHVNIKHEKLMREQYFKDQKYGRGFFNSQGHYMVPPMRGVRRPAPPSSSTYPDPIEFKRMHYDHQVGEYHHPNYGLVQNLERKLHEAHNEIVKLHEDLKRERDRYNNLLALFHRQGNTGWAQTPYV
uniref:Zinc finger CCCH domain-containing protein 10 n=1 Tax=Strongyloides venezuelensis TaxID=75913 RepID=A0A0K0G1F2_STRVS